jgi:hypothetical protein
VKWPLAVTVLGVVVVVAATVVNEAYSPDRTPNTRPDSPPMALAPVSDTTANPLSMAGRHEQEQPDDDGQADDAPVFELIRVAPEGHTVIAGRAEAGSRVVVSDGDRPLGSVVADARGEWVFLPPAPLQPGEHRLALAAQAPDRPAVLSADLMVVVVPKPGEDIAGRTARLRDRPLAMKVSRSGLGPAVVLQGPREPQAAHTLSIETIDRDATGRITFSGTAPADAVVSVYVAEQPAGQTVADSGGRWLVRTDAAPSEDHVVRADQLDDRGGVMARVAVPFTAAPGLGESRKGAPGVTAAGADGRTGRDGTMAFVEVEAGQNLWRIARNVYGRGQAYTIIYEANRNDIQNPDRIYPGQVFSLPQ